MHPLENHRKAGWHLKAGAGRLKVEQFSQGSEAVLDDERPPEVDLVLGGAGWQQAHTGLGVQLEGEPYATSPRRACRQSALDSVE